MDIIANVKEVADLIKGLGNIDLYRKILDLQGEIVELTTQNHQLETESSDLKTLLDVKGKMKWEKPVYRMEGEADPYCAQCWEASQKLIHLGDRPNGTWKCKNCDTVFSQNPNQPILLG